MRIGLGIHWPRSCGEAGEVGDPAAARIADPPRSATAAGRPAQVGRSPARRLALSVRVIKFSPRRPRRRPRPRCPRRRRRGRRVMAGNVDYDGHQRPTELAGMEWNSCRQRRWCGASHTCGNGLDD